MSPGCIKNGEQEKYSDDQKDYGTILDRFNALAMMVDDVFGDFKVSHNWNSSENEVANVVHVSCDDVWWDLFVGKANCLESENFIS